jgi:hypothetical protein
MRPLESLITPSRSRTSPVMKTTRMSRAIRSRTAMMAPPPESRGARAGSVSSSA